MPYSKYAATYIYTCVSACSLSSTRWETLRAALESYAKYAWEEDVLEITEDCVTIADDMCEEKGMHDMLEAMLDAVELNNLQHKQPPPSGDGFTLLYLFFAASFWKEIRNRTAQFCLNYQKKLKHRIQET